MAAYPAFFELSSKYGIAKMLTTDQLQVLRKIKFMDHTGWNWCIFPSVEHDNASPEARDQIMRNMLWDLQQYFESPTKPGDSKYCCKSHSMLRMI